MGRHVVGALVDDHEVTVLDLAPPVQDVPFIEGNVLDLDTVRASMAGQDAVIHLAAIDLGVPAEPEAYFGTNVMGTWNAVQAAREAGIRKVVLASSISATGVGEMRPDFPPEYLPVDEAHAMKPAHAYGVSKLVVEDIARGFALQGDMSITCLRPVAVVVESNLRRAVDRAADPGHRWRAAYEGRELLPCRERRPVSRMGMTPPTHLRGRAFLPDAAAPPRARLRPVPAAVRHTRGGTAADAQRRTVAPLSLWCDGAPVPTPQTHRGGRPWPSPPAYRSPAPVGGRRPPTNLPWSAPSRS